MIVHTPGEQHTHAHGTEYTHTDNRKPRSRKDTWRKDRRRAGRPVERRPAPVLAPWPQAVPIVEVGMRIRAHDGQGGVVVDVMDCDGTLTYLVQLDGQATAQRIPARTLKGAQI